MTTSTASGQRKKGSLRRRIASVLVFAAFAAVVVFGTLNYVAARRLLQDGAHEQLISIGESRAESTRLALDRLFDGVATSAADDGIARATSEFTDAFALLDETGLDQTGLDATGLDEAQRADLDAMYQTDVLDPLNQLGLGTYTLDDIRPATPAAEYLQYHYTLAAAAGTVPVDPGDGSHYTELNVQYEPLIDAVSQAFGGGDVMIVDTNDVVVYSKDKRIDIGSNLRDGPLRDSDLATAITEQLPRIGAGDALATDFASYVPAGGHPVLFSVAEIRADDRVIGALAVEISNEALTAITNPPPPDGADDESGESDIFDAIESYIVSTDHVLQSETRLWRDDPATYLSHIDDPEQRALTEALGSPVGVQVIDSEPVDVTLDGDDFTGSSSNFAGERTFTFATPLHTPNVGWVVVTDTPISDVHEPLRHYLVQIAIVLLATMAGAALVGFLMARRLARPVRPALDAAVAVAAGDRHPTLRTDGRDEFGDLARRLTDMASQLDAEERALAAAYESKRELLLSVLPAHLVRADGAVSGTGEVTGMGTAVAVSLEVERDPTTIDQHDAVAVLATVAAATETIANRLGLERVRVAADRHLFIAPASDDGSDGTRIATTFALDLVGTVRTLAADNDVTLAVHVGIATGAIATGVLNSGSLTFGAWGEPVRRALAIGALATSGEILLDESSATKVPDGAGVVESAPEIVDLDGEPMDLFSLSAS